MNEVAREATRKQILRRDEASDYLLNVYGIQRAPATLAKLVTTGGGPRYYKVNRSPLYPVAELDAWARKQLGPLHSSSSDFLNTQHAHDRAGVGD